MDPPTCASHIPQPFWDHWTAAATHPTHLGMLHRAQGSNWSLQQDPHLPGWPAAELGWAGRYQYQQTGSTTKENVRFSARSPSTSDTNTHSFPPSNWLLILINFSGWDFLWLLNEALAVWPLTLEPRSSIHCGWTASSLPEQPHKPHCHSPCQKPQQSQGGVSIPSLSSCFSPAPWAGATNREWGHTWSSAEPGSAMETWLWFRKINHQFQRKTPQRVIEQSHTLWLRKNYLQRPKRLLRKTTTCLSWWLWLARKGDFCTAFQAGAVSFCRMGETTPTVSCQHTKTSAGERWPSWDFLPSVSCSKH